MTVSGRLFALVATLWLGLAVASKAQEAVLPDRLIVEPKTAAQTWTGFSWTGSEKLLLGLRNSSGKAVEFSRPQVLSFSRLGAGGAETSVAAESLPVVDSSKCGTTLGPGGRCPFEIRVNTGLSPGTYRIGVGVLGTTGHWWEENQTIEVRAHAIWAFLAITIGACGGWYIRIWRESGRRAMLGLITAARLQERLGRLSAGMGGDEGFQRVADAAATAIAATEERLRSGDNAEDSLAVLGAYVDNMAAAREIHTHMRLSTAGHRALMTRWRAMLDAFDVDAPLEAQKSLRDRRIKGLAQDIRSWPQVEDRAKFAQGISAALALHERVSNGDQRAESFAIIQALDAAVKAALEPLPGDEAGLAETADTRFNTLVEALVKANVDATGIAAESILLLADEAGALLASPLMQKPEQAALRQEIERLQGDIKTCMPVIKAAHAESLRLADAQKHLEAIAALWQRFSALKAEAKRLSGGKTEAAGAGTGVGAGDAGIRGVTLEALPQGFEPPLDILLPRPGASLMELQRQRLRHEWITNGLILIVTGLAGVVALWSGNATWGSLGDILTALLSGAAARVVVGEVAGR